MAYCRQSSGILYFFSAARRTFQHGSSSVTRNDLAADVASLCALAALVLALTGAEEPAALALTTSRVLDAAGMDWVAPLPATCAAPGCCADAGVLLLGPSSMTPGEKAWLCGVATMPVALIVRSSGGGAGGAPSVLGGAEGVGLRCGGLCLAGGAGTRAAVCPDAGACVGAEA